MSLIEQALRRVQDPMVGQGPPAPAVSPPAAAPPPTQAAPAHSWPTTPAGAPPASPAPVRVNTLMAVALGLFALSAVLVIGGAFWMGRAVGRPAPSAPEPTPLSSTTPTAVPFPKPAPLKELPRLSIPWVKRAPLQEQYVLSGLIEGTGEPYAVINGMIFGVGERIGNATVVEIGNGAVKLLQPNGKETVLHLPR
ncbi:MAG: hypothetical protein HYT90_04835 [Candidatus Omnitrophica bacterium]|nr:hypothetical protein [Candidatus Omnitrophota bacterium]